MKETVIRLILFCSRGCFFANEQPHEDARLRGGSLKKPSAKVPNQDESRNDVT